MQTVWNRLPVRRLSLRTAHSALTQPSTRGPEPPRAPAEDPAGPLSIGTLRILPLKRASLPRPSSSSGPSHADMKIFFITVLLAGNALAEFTPDFADFLAGTFGPAVKDQMERRDLGSKGSFGGKTSRDERLRNQPIVFVHGVSDTAGEKMQQAARWFKSMGYKSHELYSTTYFNGAQGNPLKWVEYGMRCEYVKQVRALIVATRLYTGRALDVIAFSLGVPVSRKAILGGRCVDTGEYLGGPLTKFIDTFVGVAGPNHGISLQVGGVAIPGCMFSVIPVCNQVTGLYSGFCPNESEFLQDINKQSGYEGRHIFSIHSKKDQIVGHLVCQKITSQIPGQMGEKVFEDLNHDDTFHNSHSIQLEMIRNHVVV